MYSFSDLAALITAGYALLFLIVAGLIVWLVRPWLWKGVGLLVVCVAFAIPLVQGRIEEQKRVEHNAMIAERFMKLCKEKAGDKIVKTVKDVEGFLIMRPRTPTTYHQEYMDQYWMGDPYGHSDFEAREPEHVFLADRRAYDQSDVKIDAIAGYNFIEFPVPSNVDGEMSYFRIEVVRRYIDEHGQQRAEFKKTTIDKPRSRYGYFWEDISTPEDRKYWIAGGRMRIVDLKTQETIAERIGYLIDVEQGARVGGGKPWLLAQRHACPPFQSDSTKAKEFVAKILKPAREKGS